MSKKNKEKTVAKISGLIVFVLGILEYYMVTTAGNPSSIAAISGIITATGLITVILAFDLGK